LTSLKPTQDTSIEIKPKPVPAIGKSSAIESEIVLAEIVSQEVAASQSDRLMKRATRTQLSQTVASTKVVSEWDKLSTPKELITF
jgi:hypothetical protein